MTYFTLKEATKIWKDGRNTTVQNSPKNTPSPGNATKLLNLILHFLYKLTYFPFPLHFRRLSEEDIMNNTEDDVSKYSIEVVIGVGIVVATFLLNTGRGIKAIQLCTECWALLKQLKKEEQFVELWTIEIFEVMLKVCSLMPDDTVEYAQEFTKKLAEIYERRCNYAKARDLYERVVNIMRKTGDRKGEGCANRNIGTMSYHLGDFIKAKEYYERALAISMETGDRRAEAAAYTNLGNVFQFLGECEMAKKYYEKGLVMLIEISDRREEATVYGNLGSVLESLGDYRRAEEYHKKSLGMKIEFGDREGEALCYGNLGTLFCSLGEYVKGKEYLEKSLAIRMETGSNRKEEATDYANLGSVFAALGEHSQAKEYHAKALATRKEIGDRAGEASSYGCLGTLSYSLGECIQAKEYLGKSLETRMEIGDKKGMALVYSNLGSVCESLGEYTQTKEYFQKAIAINVETGNRRTGAFLYKYLANMCKSLCEYSQAKDYLEKALAINVEIGDRNGEAAVYGNLGSVLFLLGEYRQAKEYHEKALAISQEIGDISEEAAAYANLGTVLLFLGEYLQAKDYQEKALAINVEIGNKNGEAAAHANLGTVMSFLGEYLQAKEYHEKALAINVEIGDRKEESACYINLGTLFQSVGEYVKCKGYLEKALEIVTTGDKRARAVIYGNFATLFLHLGDYVQAETYCNKALAINKETGNRAEESTNYGILGTVFHCLGKYVQAKEFTEKSLTICTEIGDRKGKATYYETLGSTLYQLNKPFESKEYLEKALAIRMDIGDREGQASSYEHLGSLLRSLGEQVVAEEYFKKALSIFQDIGAPDKEFQVCCNLTTLKLDEENMQEALYFLRMSIDKSEDLRRFLEDNDQFKILFSDVHDFPYRKLSALFCLGKNPNRALYVLELARARALTDLMAAQYSVKSQISANPQSWSGIENVMKKESNCTCLYISHYGQKVFLWILTTSGAIYFRNENTSHTGLVGNLDDILAKHFPSFGMLSEENCEDRSLNHTKLKTKSSQEESPQDLRLVEDTDEDYQDFKPLFYKMLIAPVAELLVEPEIVIVPDRNYYQVPFASLQDENGTYLSETFRIRIVPSLTTVKLIQDIPADFHSETGALIVGDPVVGRVLYKGSLENKKPLPCARKEAEMIGRLLGVAPLLGEHATKQAVLHLIHSVSLIHFAAHGNAERGEIALSPVHSNNKIPEEEEYLLTMSDISHVQLRAKLVVLSCCHSGSGQISAEGVIGIARAFLGSGARSVLVALWALEDSATEQLMRRFYEHLVRGESASECLHEAMKWMRCNGYSDVRQWAPFMLIGDNVTFDFGEKVTFI